MINNLSKNSKECCLHCGDVLAGESIGGVADQKTSLTDGTVNTKQNQSIEFALEETKQNYIPIADHDTLDSLHFVAVSFLGD